MKSNRSLTHRLLVALLSAELAFGAVPVRAWAQEGTAYLDGQQPSLEEPVELTQDEPAPPVVPDSAAAQFEELDSTDAVETSTATDQATQATPTLTSSGAEKTEVSGTSPSTEYVEIVAQAEERIAVSAEIIGLDAAGNAQSWVSRATYEITQGMTAADLTEQLLGGAGLQHKVDTTYGYFLESITGPTGTELATASDYSRYWQLFVNGKASDLGASSVVLAEGDSLVWYYSGWGDELPQDVHATVKVIGADGSWWRSVETVSAFDTKADVLTEVALGSLGLAHDVDTQYGYFLNSITAPDGTVLATAPDYSRYWQLFVNGSPSDVGASDVAVTEGMDITWYYSGWGDSIPDLSETDKTITATCEIIGPEGAWSTRRELVMPVGSTAADLTKQALEAAGLAYTCSDTSWGWSLDSITSPSGEVIAMDPVTWDYWRLFVDGELSDAMADGVVLAQGSSIVWSYGAYGAELPSGDIVIDPDAQRPEYEADWSGYKGTDLTGTIEAPTPTEAAELVWSASLLGEGKFFTNVSDLVLVNGCLFVAADNVIYCYDATTGALKAQAPLAATVSYTSRIRYADGLVLVPLEGGSVQAITADTLTTVWLSDEMPQLAGWNGELAPQQNSSTILTHEGYAYLGTTDGAGTGGNLLCLSLETGALRWSHTSACGYYWAGCAMTDAGLVVADDAGTLALVDPVTGEVKTTLALGSGCRASVTAAGDGQTVYVVTKDGVLRKVVVTDGQLTAGKSVKFAASSTTTPTVTSEGIVAAGVNEAYKGTLSIVDPETMEVTTLIDVLDDNAAIPGDIKSAPLVAQTEDGVYVYFTANSLPGSLYVYKLGEALARELYQPASAQQNYCMASVIAGHDGMIYYTNDSATIFALKAVDKKDDEEKPDQKPDDNKQSDDTKPSGNKPSGNKPSDGKGQKDDAGSKIDNTSVDGMTRPSAFIPIRGNVGALAGLTSTASGGITTKAADAITTKGEKGADKEEDDATSSDVAKTDDAADVDATVDGAVDVDDSDNPLVTLGAVDEPSEARRLPVWPIAGMACGALVLLWALFGRRRKEDDTENEE